MPKGVPLGGVTAETGSAAREDHRIGLPAIFAAFLWLGLTSFGGNTAAWLYHRIVQRRHWITDAEFLSGVALSRIMPGSGGVNLTVQVGQRLCGRAGAVAAVVGLLSGPLVIVVAVAVAYARIGSSPAVNAVLDGIAAAAIGLTFATGLQLLPSGSGRLGPLTVILVTVPLRRRIALAHAAGDSVPGTDQHLSGIGATSQCLTISGHCWR